ncbi:MAG: glycosyltransferase family 2 protein [Lachnospiraceae bacterium]|nr:glycosyltransferase family 2 protein [Lachnospiraceae bacterium]
MQKKNIIVTVIIPVYNVERYLREAIDSVLRQSYSSIEIILIDDGSQDNSPQICDQYSEKYENIIVIHKENGGLSSARNEGIQYISENSEYILFFDSDDILYEDAIAGMVDCAEKSKADMIVPDRYETFNTKESKVVRHFPNEMYTENPKDFGAYVLINKGRAWRAHSLLYKTALITKNKLKFINGVISEDIFFNLDYLSIAGKIQIYNKPTVKYRIREGSISRSFCPDYERIIWMMDEYVSRFLKVNNYGDEYRRSLTKRNIVLYMTSIMSKGNSMPSQEKRKFAQALLKQPRTVEAFSLKTDYPYFNSRVAVNYFKLQYWLIEHKMTALSLEIAKLRGML